MRVATISMMVMRFFAAMALNGFRQCVARARIRVPSLPGLREFSTSTGMFFCTAGSNVEGCRTFAPKYASSAASSKAIVLMRSAFGQIFGSVVFMPSTSVQISMRVASSPAPTIAAEVRSTAADRGHDSFTRCADESAHHRNHALAQQRTNFHRQPVVCCVELWDRSRELVVCDDALAGVHVSGIHAKRGEGSRDNLAVDALSERKDVVGGARRDFADGADSAYQII